MAWIAALLDPPEFPGDAEKNRKARLMNALGLCFAAILLAGALVYLPFFSTSGQKLIVGACIASLFVVWVVSRILLFRGRLRAASSSIVIALWLFSMVLSIFSDGTTGPVSMAIVGSTITVALLTESRSGVVILVLSVLAELGLAIARSLRYPLPVVFSFSPLGMWVWFALSLGFTFVTVSLVMHNLREAFGEADRRGEALLRAEGALRRNEERFQGFMQHFPGLAYIKDADGLILFANRGFQTYLGIDPKDMVGKTNAEFFGSEFGDKITGDDRAVIQSGTAIDVDEEFAGRSWSTLKFPILQSGSASLLGGITIDVTERNASVERIQASLREKEILLKELYHRTKNNMQVISSMFSLQSDFESDPHVLELFRAMDNRIQAMALVHTKLYQSRSLSRINLGEYVGDLAQLLWESFEGLGDRVAIATEAAELSVLIDTAMPCGIILNELVSNAFKHGFPGQRRGSVAIRVAGGADDWIEIEVSDDGVGPSKDFDARRSGRLGLESVVNIVELQLHGTLSFDFARGFACRIRFRNDLYKERV